ncbi:tetratricopeptide repeat protein [Archangium sp.]|uniref:tetratricopeptide repeat protein n=1 Tax=Archangium sp. TaxID=1872627 RepID=UPI002D5DE85F|nr:tetratricopeptide repeat protein [Archangium sp.]HYO56589.1 tetratricopeptide repeat protein [Archangium sp.]
MAPPALTAKGEEEWQTLRYHVEWSRGFVLVFLFTSDLALQELLRERLERICLLRTVPLEKLSPRNPATLVEEVLEPIRQSSSVLAEVRSPLWIDLASGRGPEWERARDNLLARINEHREWLRRLGRPVVIVLPSGYRPRLRELAPDLWAIRGYSLDMGEPGLLAGGGRESGVDAAEGGETVRPTDVPAAASAGDEARLKEWERLERTSSNESAVLMAGLQAMDIALRLSRLDMAQRIAAEVIARARSRVETAPEVSRLLGIALNGVGQVAEVQGRLEEAEAAYRESLELSRGQRERVGDTPEVVRDLSVSLQWLGDVLGAQGKLDEAMACYDEARRLRQRLALALPHIPEHQRAMEEIGQVIEALRRSRSRQS